jgi:hypothetical protein
MLGYCNTGLSMSEQSNIGYQQIFHMCTFHARVHVNAHAHVSVPIPFYVPVHVCVYVHIQLNVNVHVHVHVHPYPSRFILCPHLRPCPCSDIQVSVIGQQNFIQYLT